jgi:hypothetical protein
MHRTTRSHAWLFAAFLLVTASAQATEVDLMGLDVEGVRLGMDTREAGAALDNRGYEQVAPTSFKRKDRNGMHYVGMKLNPGGEIISVEAAHFLNRKIDPDAHRDQWIERWGDPDKRMGNPGHDWKLTYENDAALMDTWAKSYPRSELRMRLVSKGKVLASRRGHEVRNEICMGIKDKPVSLLNTNDRNNLMECIRTGQLRIVAP